MKRSLKEIVGIWFRLTIIRALERAQQNGVSWLLENGYKSAMGYAFGESSLFLIGHPDCVDWRKLKQIKETQ